MTGSYHIIPDMGSYCRRGKEEYAPTLCGLEVIRGRHDFCSVSSVNPNWNKEWCSSCVQVLPWTDKAKKLWRAKGIEIIDEVEDQR